MSDSPPDTPLWLSHHWSGHYDRCVQLGRRHVCRRCVVLYPMAALAAIVVAVVELPEHLLFAAMWLLPAPMALDWALEHSGRIRYSARRQMTLTLIGAPALGVALGIHSQHPFSLVAVLPVAFWLLTCATVAVLTTVRSAAPDADWRARHDADEAARHERLAELLEAHERLRSPR